MVRQWDGSHDLVPLTIDELDISDLGATRAAVDATKPDLVVNCAAYNFVDDAEQHPDDAYRANALGPRNLAIAVGTGGIPLVHYSTDYVFDGRAATPYVEYDATSPQGVYARSKAAGEQAVRDHTDRFYLIRVAWLAGHGGSNFVETMLRLGAERDTLQVVSDQIGTPTFCADVTRETARLVETAQFGLYHMTSKGQCSWYDFAVGIFRATGMDRVTVDPVPTTAFPRPAPRPAYGVLRNMMLELSIGDDMPEWQDALGEYLAAR